MENHLLSEPILCIVLKAKVVGPQRGSLIFGELLETVVVNIYEPWDIFFCVFVTFKETLVMLLVLAW